MPMRPEMTKNIVSGFGATVLERKLTVGSAMERFDSEGALSDEMVKRSLESILAGLSDLAQQAVAA